MFERYTEAARRLVFFAHAEAAQAGSLYIETEHLALAFCDDEASLLRRMLAPELLASLEQRLQAMFPAKESAARQIVDLPLSQTMKRVLQSGAEEAEKLGAGHIGTEHLLLGLLNETDSPVVQVLKEFSITRERVLAGLGGAALAAQPVVTRESLHALVDILPEGALPQVHNVLARFQTWPPQPRPVPPRIAELRKQRQDQFQRSIPPGKGMAGGSGGSWRSDVQGNIRDGHYSSGRIEDGVHVTETHRFFQGHEITIIERVKVKDGEKSLWYSQEVSGPGRQHQFEIDFEIG